MAMGGGNQQDMVALTQRKLDVQHSYKKAFDARYFSVVGCNFVHVRL